MHILTNGTRLHGVFENKEFAIEQAIKHVDAVQPGKWRGKREAILVAKYDTHEIFYITHQLYGQDWKVREIQLNVLTEIQL